MNKRQKRLTIDLSPEVHHSLKGLCGYHGVSMREFVLAAICRQLDDLEDQVDLEMVEETRRRIASGEEELIGWDEMVKRLGWNKL